MALMLNRKQLNENRKKLSKFVRDSFAANGVTAKFRATQCVNEVIHFSLTGVIHCGKHRSSWTLDFLITGGPSTKRVVKGIEFNEPEFNVEKKVVENIFGDHAQKQNANYFFQQMKKADKARRDHLAEVRHAQAQCLDHSEIVQNSIYDVIEGLPEIELH